MWNRRGRVQDKEEEEMEGVQQRCRCRSFKIAYIFTKKKKNVEMKIVNIIHYLRSDFYNYYTDY